MVDEKRNAVVDRMLSGCYSLIPGANDGALGFFYTKKAKTSAVRPRMKRYK